MVSRTLLAGAVAFGTLLAGLAHAQNTTQPGFVPDTGQINPGHALQPPPTKPPETFADAKDVRAALTMPNPGTISPGERPNASGKPQPATSGKGITSTEGPGPIASTLETKPAKFSHRNDVLDHTATMAWPTVLDPQQRRTIFQAVTKQGSPASATTKDFKLADAVPFALTGQIHPLPASLRGAPDLRGIAAMKGKDKVYLVTTTTADPVVVDILDGK